MCYSDWYLGIWDASLPSIPVVRLRLALLGCGDLKLEFFIGELIG